MARVYKELLDAFTSSSSRRGTKPSNEPSSSSLSSKAAPAQDIALVPAPVRSPKVVNSMASHRASRERSPRAAKVSQTEAPKVEIDLNGKPAEVYVVPVALLLYGHTLTLSTAIPSWV